MSSLKFIKLSAGGHMPSVGLGTFMLNGNIARETVDKALFLGYKHIDTALSYGNEVEIGEVIKDRENLGKVKRKDIFLTSKVPSVYLERKDLYRSIEQSLDNLKQKYVDLMLIHHPWGLVNRGDGTLRPVDSQGRLEFQQYDLVDSWRGMEDAKADGLVKAIGLSNFTMRQIEKIMSSCKSTPTNLQLECHAYLQQRNIKEFCNQRGITLTAYGPLGAPGRPSHHRSPDQVELLDDPVIEELAKNHNRTKGNILLRWLLQQGFTVVPKCKSEERLKENLNVFDFELSSSDMDKINTLDRNLKYFHFRQYKGHPDFSEEEEF
ncbi:hypothetical protein FSP39_022155 [Pinctada imbricata]|uniref:NADP-dependent oxidoreductase domain-containing protein n=1 Tax=Pinctada imbricata TaxID=66713 RepID=A0AA89BZ84_PINIB|nr:hypothetical protein FSP39_022155 [Pinctada imbricata]